MRSRVLAAALLLLSAAPALADQIDPRLPALFERLKAGPEAAVVAEAEIWQIWSEIFDAESAELLAEGTAAMATRSWPTALERFDALVERSPNFAEAWNKRATLHYLMGDYPASVADIQRTLALEPRHFGALSGLGLIFMTIGDPEPAIESFEAALAIHPYMPGARQNIEGLRAQVGGQEL
ncbi:MAG TPA: tetratricopeptide repeat protein [Geminicoccaceae bacterium]|nr:tetratricopeptide repeat protein [Geminicoccus sp.]HMU51372.1 tetratricopeptide repeat protein [Geminicoccaceae bacterium]